MKKQLFITLFALGVSIIGISTTQAQNSTTNLNIILTDVLSIDSGVAVGGSVNFNYLTANDYHISKSVKVLKSLVVTSSRNFDIKVKANGVNFTNGSNLIPINILKIRAVSGGTMNGNFKVINLSTIDQKLVSGASKGSKKSLTIKYTISANKAATVLLGKPVGSYTQTITYTATVI